MDKAELLAKAKNYIAWEKHAAFKTEVEQLLSQNQESELEERFYTELSFGTGGIRGIMGGGFNRMNPFMVQRASEGFARYVRANGSKAPDGSLRIVIAYDSRNNSRLFAESAAEVFTAHGIAVYLFSDLRPTPELSFAVRHLRASGGIVITASHNPKQYNGYKVYWNDGAQVVPPHDQAIIDLVQTVGNDIQTVGLNEAHRHGLLHVIDNTIDSAFLSMARSQLIRTELFGDATDFKVVYTPLHGTGGVLIPRACIDLGLPITEVPSQIKPDGEFPTVVYPNPEDGAALRLAIDQAKAEQAELVIGTDPDADRIGIAVRHGDDFVLLNGNQHGVLLVDYVFGALQDRHKMPKNPAFINTIVTTALQRVIAQSYGAQVFEVLTGFKWIAAKMREFEQAGSPIFVIGGEESYGFLIGREVRDKDSITASLMTIEMALYWRSQGKSLLDRLDELYKLHGYYQEIQIAKEFDGAAGVAKISQLMDYARANPPKTLGGQPLTQLRDIKKGTTTLVATAEVIKNSTLPPSNVLQFVLGDGTIISARPSGTEPKIKFYASVGSPAGMDLAAAKAMVAQKIVAIRADLESFIQQAVT